MKKTKLDEEKETKFQNRLKQLDGMINKKEDGLKREIGEKTLDLSQQIQKLRKDQDAKLNDLSVKMDVFANDT